MVTFEEMPLDILLVIIKFIAQLPEAQDCAPGETLGNLSSTSHGMRKLVAPILFDRLFIYASTWSATGQRTMRYALDAIRASGLLQQARYVFLTLVSLPSSVIPVGRHLTVYMEAADLRWHFSDDFIDLLKSVPHLQTMHYPYFEVAEAPEDVLDAINIHPTLRVVELELLSPDYTGSHGEDLSKYRYSHYTIDSDVPDKVDLVNSTTKRGASLTALTVFQKDSEMRWPIEAIRGLQKISFFGCYPPTSDAFIHRHSTLTRIKITGNKPNEALPTVLWTSIPLLRDSLEVYYDTNGPSLCLRTAVLSRSHVNERWACTEAAWIVECSDEEQLMYAVQAMSTAFPALQSLRISVLQDSKIITPRSSIVSLSGSACVVD